MGRGLCATEEYIHFRVKGTVYKTVVRPTMMYGADTWAVKKAQEKKLEMMMLRWTSGVTKLDTIRNEKYEGQRRLEEYPRKYNKVS